MDNKVRNIAPFINDRFLITSAWWTERVDPITGETKIHRGLDIATTDAKKVYSILDGVVHSKGYNSSRGNWIIIKDNDSSSSTYGYASLYMHLATLPNLIVGQKIKKNEYVGLEGTTGSSTGIHLHVEMQDLNRWNNVWHTSYNKSDYLDPTIYMGIDNEKGSWWIYSGTPVVNIPKKKKFPWFIISKKRKSRFY